MFLDYKTNVKTYSSQTKASKILSELRNYLDLSESTCVYT